jgi:hypothetical protein
LGPSLLVHLTQATEWLPSPKIGRITPQKRNSRRNNKQRIDEVKRTSISDNAFSLGPSDLNLYKSKHTDERCRDISSSTFPPSSLGQGAGGSPSGMGREIARAKAEGSGRALGQGSESNVESFGKNLVLKSIRAKGIWHYDPDGRLIRSTDLESASSYDSQDHESPILREQECLTGISRQFGEAIPQSTRSPSVQDATQDFGQNTGITFKTFGLSGDNYTERYAGFIHPEQLGIIWIISFRIHPDLRTNSAKGMETAAPNQSLSPPIRTVTSTSPEWPKSTLSP